MIEQEAVADGGIILPCNVQAELHSEQVRVFTFGQQATRVVCQVAEPAFKLPFSEQNPVIISTGKQEAVLAVVARTRWSWAFGLLSCLLTCLLSCLLWQCHNTRDGVPEDGVLEDGVLEDNAAVILVDIKIYSIVLQKSL